MADFATIYWKSYYGWHAYKCNKLFNIPILLQNEKVCICINWMEMYQNINILNDAFMGKFSLYFSVFSKFCVISTLLLKSEEKKYFFVMREMSV